MWFNNVSLDLPNLTNTSGNITRDISYLSESPQQKLYAYLSQNINLHQKQVNMMQISAEQKNIHICSSYFQFQNKIYFPLDCPS